MSLAHRAPMPLLAVAIAATAPAHAAVTGARTCLAVVAVGTPNDTLTDAAAPVRIPQITADEANIGSWTTLPSTGPDAFKLSGNHVGEGHLASMPDGSVLLHGYNAPGHNA